MSVEVYVDYDKYTDELYIKTSKGVEWRLFTSSPEIHLSSLMGATFGELFNKYFQHETEIFFKLTFEKYDSEE